jgi:hypothetical protein
MSCFFDNRLSKKQIKESFGWMKVCVKSNKRGSATALSLMLSWQRVKPDYDEMVIYGEKPSVCDELIAIFTSSIKKLEASLQAKK